MVIPQTRPLSVLKKNGKIVLVEVFKSHVFRAVQLTPQLLLWEMVGLLPLLLTMRSYSMRPILTSNGLVSMVAV